jgi:hypothetical protein
MLQQTLTELRIAVVAVVALLVVMPPSFVHGQGMMGRGAGMRRDTVAAAVMPVVHDLMMNHQKLRRTVTNLPDGVRTVTESDDSAMVGQLQNHVATTGVLVAKSQDLNVPPASPTLRQLLQRGASITRLVEHTPQGVVVTETSKDSVTVSLLQAHAAEVTELVNRGMAAMHEKMMQRRSPPPP